MQKAFICKDEKIYWSSPKEIPVSELAELLIKNFAEEKFQKDLLKYFYNKATKEENGHIHELIKANELWFDVWRSKFRLGTFLGEDAAEKIFNWLKKTARQDVYHQIYKNLTGKKYRNKRRTHSGLDLVITQEKINFKLPDCYSFLQNIPVITTSDGDYPISVETPSKRRDGNIIIPAIEPKEKSKILSNFKKLFCPCGWRIFPTLMGGADEEELMAFHLFPEKFETTGFGQFNLFEMANPKTVKNRQPDSILIYGAPQNLCPSQKMAYIDDKEDGIILTLVPDSELYSYFGYLKKPAVQAANIWALNQGYWPFHGMVASIQIETLKPFVVLCIGDTMVGKSETAVGIKKYAEKQGFNIKIKILVDDMGALDDDLNILSWERIGGFVKTDGIIAGPFAENDRRYDINRNYKPNPRSVIPYIDYDPYEKITPNLVCIGNNFTPQKNPLKFFNNAQEAIDPFWRAERMAGGSVQGIDHSQVQTSPCGNPFIGGRTDIYLNRTIKYLNQIKDAGKDLAIAYTELMRDEIDGPEKCGKAIVEYIINKE